MHSKKTMSIEYQKEIMKFYDTVYEEFDKTRVHPDPFLEILVANGFAKNSKIILDNGCGNCRNLKPFNKEIIAVAGDISKNMLKQCRRNRPGLNTFYIQYALTNLPFRENVFDGIICIAAIHHLKKDEAFKSIMEMAKALNDRGWLIISSWSNRILKSKRFFKKIEKTNDGYFLVKWGPYKRIYFLMDAKMLREICENAGLESVNALEYGMNSYILVDKRCKANRENLF